MSTIQTVEQMLEAVSDYARPEDAALPLAERLEAALARRNPEPSVTAAKPEQPQPPSSDRPRQLAPGMTVEATIHSLRQGGWLTDADKNCSFTGLPLSLEDLASLGTARAAAGDNPRDGAVEAEISRLNALIAESKAQTAALEKRAEELKAETERLNAQSAEIRAKISAFEAARSPAEKAEIESLRAQIAEREKEILDLNQRANRAAAALPAAANRLAALHGFAETRGSRAVADMPPRSLAATDPAAYLAQMDSALTKHFGPVSEAESETLLT